MNSIQLQDAVIRRIEIMGEAVKNTAEDFKEKYPDVPWQDIAGTRDKLIHGYFGIDLELIWEVTQSNIPELKREISRIRKELS